MEDSTVGETPESKPSAFGWARLIWIPLFLLLIWALPQPDAATEARLLRDEAVISDLVGGLDAGLEEIASDAKVLREPTTGEIWRSWFGNTDALPPAPEGHVVIAIESVEDHSFDGLGLSAEELDQRRWTTESFLSLPGIDPTYIRFASVADAPAEAQPARLRIVRLDSGAIQATLTAANAEAPPAFVTENDPGWLPESSWGGASWTSTAEPFNRYSVLPPIVAIGLALILRSALIALLGGVLAGGFVLAAGADANGLMQSWDLLKSQLVDEFRITIVLFVLFLVGMIGVITRIGGVQGLVNLMTRKSEGARSTRIVTALMGFVIFFDDYSNSVVVGTSMRPLTDKLKIAREKLAYLIDSTAAPIAGIALFSTWIGYEVSQYDAALRVVDPARAEEAYSIFLMTIPLRFYCIFTLAFVLVNVFTSRDFGPMLAAERRSASTGKVIRDGARPLTSARFAKLTPAEGVTPRAFNAVFPLAVVVIVMLVGFWFVGGGIASFQNDGWASFSLEGIGATLGNDYTMHVAVVASAIGSLLAIALALRAIPFMEAIRAWSVGFSSLIVAILILITAWALAQACGDLRAGQYLVASVGSDLPLVIQPIVFFVLACLIAFATGTSWGTMAILIPIAIPLAYFSEGLVPGDPLAGTITLLSFGAVLEGSIFGDHCSPISDTTVLSSVSAGSDHLDHVKTQIPYALSTMGIALLIGYLPVGLGWYGPSVAIPLGIIACVAILLLVGKKLPEASVVETEEAPA